MSNVPAALHPTETDISMMLACQVHLGTGNLDANMGRYVYKRRTDGGYLFKFHDVFNGW